MRTPQQAPPIDDYALIGDCHAAALVSRYGSIDWCCMPRFDSEPCFGRLLDWRRGGNCAIMPLASEYEGDRAYLDGSLVICTTFRTESGQARIYDCMALDEARLCDDSSQSRLVRIVEGVDGSTDLRVQVLPRFDFGDVKPWIRELDDCVFTAVGGNKGLVISGDMELRQEDQYSLSSSIRVHAGERRCLGIEFVAPERLDDGPESVPSVKELQRNLDDTVKWWRAWSAKIQDDDSDRAPGVHRSALVLKALNYAPTGAIIAAPTTSLPEGLQGTRTWDYRFSWIRDAAFTADVMVELGGEAEAYGFRRFIERSSAGSAKQFQTLYGIDGSRRQDEFDLKHLEGYRGATPVRIGNQASQQMQLDVFGEMLELSWIWHRHGHSPSDDYWRFLVDLVNRVRSHWRDPDHGIWEMRGEPQHFVHSKVMCWSALNRGIGLARELDRDAPVKQWTEAREQVRAAIEQDGYDRERGIFIQAFERNYLDAALLRMPSVGFIEYTDQRMIRTTDAIRAGLDADGLLRRYDSPDGLPGEEGAFLACSFWLVECLAGQQRFDEAQQVFDRAAATANDVGLFSEEYDVDRQQLLANFPQGLTHLSHISAVLALRRRAAVTERRVSGSRSN